MSVAGLLLARMGSPVAPPPAPGGDPFPGFEAFDRDTVPFHAGSGAWQMVGCVIPGA